VRKLVEVLAENEWDNLIREYKLRDKWERRTLPYETPEDLMYRYLNAPIKNREIEKVINPFQIDWEYRYYKELFGVEIDDDIIKDICINYLEGLEWNIKYYSEGCIDWRWHYKYNYPPLLKDILKYIPYFKTEMITKNNHTAVNPVVQLSYVLPQSSLYLLPNNIHKMLTRNRLHYYPENANLCWAFCKYIWESHVELPAISIEDLEKIFANYI
jgi:5'-3' exoribonuclease 1